MSRTFPHVVLVDLNPAVRDALADVFNVWAPSHPDETSPHVTVPLAQDFRLLLPTDAVISPANSYGLMDGGFDAALTRLFGDGLQLRAQDYIRREYAGEQPVGTAFVVDTERTDCPFLIHAPTMRYPADISGTVNVYYAMKAILVAAWKHPRITKILVPGLGTLSGRMDPRVAAKQMELAYRHVRSAALEQETTLEPAPLTVAQKWERALRVERAIESLRAGTPTPLVTPEFVARQAEVPHVPPPPGHHTLVPAAPFH